VHPAGGATVSRGLLDFALPNHGGANSLDRRVGMLALAHAATNLVLIVYVPVLTTWPNMFKYAFRVTIGRLERKT